MAPIDFVNAIRKARKRTLPNHKMTPDAVELMDFLCNDFNSKLVDETKEEYRRAKKKQPELTHEYAEMALRKIVKTRMKAFAVAEGQKAVFKFTSKLLRYDDTKAREFSESERARKASKRKEQPKKMGADFYRGLTSLAMNVHQDQKLDRKAKTYAADLIYNLTKALARKAAAEARGLGSITEEEVQLAIESSMGPAMADHSKKEGRHAFLLYSNGQFPHALKLHGSGPPPKRRKTSEEPAASDRVPLTNVFRQGIKKLCVEVHNGCRMQPKAVNYMDNLLTVFSRRMAVAASGVASSHRVHTMGAQELDGAIRALFPENMARYALPEGARAVTLHSAGLLRIPAALAAPKPLPQAPGKVSSKQDLKKKKKPSKKGLKRLKKSAKKVLPTKPKPKRPRKPAVPDFTSGVIKLTSEFADSIKIDRNSSDKINQILLNICRKLATKACAIGLQGKEAKEVTANSVGSAVQALFKGELKKAAMKEGKRVAERDAPPEGEKKESDKKSKKK